jgi:hypothetical protein
MPKNKVSDPITDQEMAFARLVLSGTMTDRHAAETAGLNPDSAAYIKSKPHVRAYMLEHRAAVQQQLVEQEADLSRRAVDGLRRLSLDRERVLDRLWEIANMSPDMTRGSITGQVKALSMIIAMENFIPDRRLISEKKSATVPAPPQIYEAAWLRKQQATTMAAQPSPAPAQQEDSPDVPDLSSRLSRPAVEPERPVPACRGSVVEGPAVPLPPTPDPTPDLSESTFANRFSPSEALPRVPYVPYQPFVPDTRVGFSIKKNPFNPFVRPR